LCGQKGHIVSVFESIYVRSMWIYAYLMVAIISTVFIMILDDLSHKMIFCSFRHVIWLITQVF